MSGTSGGLGRGLAAILTGPSAPTEPDNLRARFIASALDALDDQRSLEYCGYVHESDNEVDVTLRSPALGSLHPTSAYRLFKALAEASAGDDAHVDFMVGEVPCRCITLEINGTSGLFFFGDTNLADADVDRLTAFCALYGRVIIEHDIAPRDNERVHLVMDQQGGAVHAEVSVAGRVGFGSAERTHQAAAQAALGALCPNAKLVEVGDVRSNEGAASFVVAAGEHGKLAMGAAPVASGPDPAAAVAAVRAARALAA